MITSNLHPYDPIAADLTREPSSQHPRHYRAAILCRFKIGADGSPYWAASVKRSPSDRAKIVRLPAHLGPDAAAAHLISRLGLGWRMLPAAGSVDGGETYCYVAELTPGEGRALAGGERAVLAMLAARELEALTLGDATADAVSPYGVAVALSRMATGTDRVRPLISGWRADAEGTAATDHLGRPLLSFGGDMSPAHALAACAAAGWVLTTDARQVAAKHMGDPDPAAVAAAAAVRRAQGVAS